MSDYPIPYLFIQTPPATEPLTIAEAKLYLRLDGSSEDTLITQFIRAARQAAERYTRRSLISQSWMLAFDDYAPSRITLPRGPVQSITSVKITSRIGVQTTISNNTYYLNAGKEQLVFDVTPLGHMIEIIYVTGFGTSADVPDGIKQGMLAHIADMYDKRTMDGMMNGTTIAFYKPYRTIEL